MPVSFEAPPLAGDIHEQLLPDAAEVAAKFAEIVEALDGSFSPEDEEALALERQDRSVSADEDGGGNRIRC